MIELARIGNKYLADSEPWKLIKTPQKEKVNSIINISIQICCILAIVSEPFLPSSSKKLKIQFNVPNINWNDFSVERPLIPKKIYKSDLIFRKIEDDEIDFQLKKLHDSEQ